MSDKFNEQPVPAGETVNVATRKSGRAIFSDDGRSTWEWQTATGVFTTNISDEQLTRLEAPDLRLDEAPPIEDSWTSASGRFSRADIAAIARSQRHLRGRQSSDDSMKRSPFHRLFRRLAGATWGLRTQ